MDRITLYITDVRELAGQEQPALTLLTPRRRETAKRIRPEQDRLCCIAAGLLLRCVLGVTSDNELRQGEFGKLELTGEGPCFNLSHGGNYAVLAVDDDPVGVDVEPVGEKLPIAIPRRYLTPDELSWLEAEPTPERFARLWTRLESVLKADGRGFAMEERRFSVVGDVCPWEIKTLTHDGHVISCAAGKPFEMKIRRLSVRELMKWRDP